MLPPIIIELIILIIALIGLVSKPPMKDLNEPISWKKIINLEIFNYKGKVTIFLLLFLTILNINKNINNLKYQNQLQRIISVACGYNAIIRGAVSFDIIVTDPQIRAALQNLFLKFCEINISAENELGHHKGRVDHAAHPEVRRYIRLSDIEKESEFYRYKEKLGFPNSYYFEIRCSGIRILNENNIQYARFQSDERIDDCDSLKVDHLKGL